MRFELMRPTQWGFRRHWSVAGLAVLTAAACLLLRRSLFPYGYSGDSDEALYVLQARMLLHGQLSLPASQFSGALRPWLTGELHGRVFTQYLPGWPAMLAASYAVAGTFAAAPALAAAAWVVATYALALELLRDRRVALAAGLFLATSPLLLLHGMLYLSYAFSAAALTGAAACLLNGSRRQRRAPLLGAGALFGVALLARPFDVVLVAVPCLAYLVVRQRSALTGLARSVAWAFFGGAPFVLVLLVFDARVTGAPLLLPLAASDPLNTFGFGARRILPGQPLISYPASQAVRALRHNLVALPSWLFGGAGMLALAATAVLPRRQRLERLLLLVLAAAFPLGYLFWWATSLSALGALNGIGPHYYLPTCGPLAILAADAAVRSVAWVSRRCTWVGGAGLAAAMLAGGLLLTLPSIPPKAHSQQYVNSVDRGIKRLLPRHLRGARTVVIVSAQPPSTFVGIPYQFLANGPDLSASTLYAADLGADQYQLALRFPDRQLVSLRPNQLAHAETPFGPRGRQIALSAVSGQRLTFGIRIVNRGRHSYLTSYLRLNDRERDHVLSRHAYPGAVFNDSWSISRGDVRGPTIITLGVAASDTADLSTAERWEQRISVGPSAAGLTTLLPGREWRRITFPALTTWLEASTQDSLEVSATNSPVKPH